MGFIWLIH